MKIFNAIREEVATLVNEYQQVGFYSSDFDAKNLSSRIYFYKLQVGSFVETKKMLMLR